MSFCFYPELEQSCPNVSHCPHLGGAAIGTVVELANETLESREHLFRTIDAERKTDEEKVSGTIVVNLWPSTGPDRGFKSKACDHLSGPMLISEWAAATDTTPQSRQFGFRLRIVDVFQPTGRATDRPRCQ